MGNILIPNPTKIKCIQLLIKIIFKENSSKAHPWSIDSRSGKPFSASADLSQFKFCRQFAGLDPIVRQRGERQPVDSGRGDDLQHGRHSRARVRTGFAAGAGRAAAGRGWNLGGRREFVGRGRGRSATWWEY